MLVTVAIIGVVFMDVCYALNHGGGWMVVENKFRKSNWALVRVTIYILRNNHLTVFVLADRLQITSTDELDVFQHFPHCSFSKSLHCSKTANDYFRASKTRDHWFPSSHLVRRSYDSRLPLRWRPLHRQTSHLESEISGGRFEGLLRGDNGSAKVISFSHGDGP